jgi:hypothetical protein
LVGLAVFVDQQRKMDAGIFAKHAGVIDVG